MASEDAGRRASGDAMLGEEVGIWRISRLLGRGGMGRVYEAVQPSTGGRVAIKIMAPDVGGDADAVKRFFAEARAVNLIHHEHIVDVLAMATLPDGRPYIVMEYLAGAPLRALIRRGPLPLGSLAELISEALDALDAAHARGVVHRDLKPDNLFVTPAGHAKLLDFGLVKLAPDLGADMPETRTGVVMGTPPYMAPEYIAGGEADHRSDLYAMGVILFEAATGRLPFTATSGRELFRQHVEETPPAPRSLRADIPEGYEAVILQALFKTPGQRFASAGEMARCLRSAARSLPEEAWQPLQVPEPTPAADATPAAGDAGPDQVATVDAVGRQPSSTQPTAPLRAPAPSPTPASVGLAPGTRLGDRYRIEELLGSGGMGRVYRAADLTLDREVALKTLRVQSDRGLDRLRREVKLASRITHPNVIRLYDLDADGETSFVTMELIRGSSLRGRIAAGPLAVTECVKLARACALGLAAAHRVGVVHRDFKPENVLIDADGRVVVADFGVAGEPSEDTEAASAIVGTSKYMAPEQADGLAPTPAADLYALGLVLYEMLTGEVPLVGRTPLDTAARRRTGPTPAVRERRAEVDEALDRLIGTLLAPDPAARPASAGAVVDELAAMTAGPRAPARARRRWLGAAAVVALLGAAGTAVVRWPRGGDPAPTPAPTLAPVALPASPDAGASIDAGAITEAVAPIDAGAVDTGVRVARRPKPPPPKPTQPTVSLTELNVREARSWSRIDPSKILPDVRKLARRLAPDAQLVSLDASCVGPDGAIALDRCAGDGRVKYQFVSAANKDRRPPELGLIGDDGVTRYGVTYVCVIEVMVNAQGLRATWRTSTAPCRKLTWSPRCTLAQVRRRATEVPPTSGDAIPGIEELDALWINMRIGSQWNMHVRKGLQSLTWLLPDDC